MRKALKSLLTAGLALGSYLPITRAEIAPEVSTEISTNLSNQITYQWGVRNKSLPASFHNGTNDYIKSYSFQEDFDETEMENFEVRGVGNPGEIQDWSYSNEENTYTVNEGGLPIWPSFELIFSATIDKDKVIGNRQIQSEATAMDGYISVPTTNTLITVPITPYTTTIGGATVGLLQRLGSTNDNTMAYFNSESTNNVDSDAFYDWEEILIGGDTTSVSNGLIASFSMNPSNDTHTLSWTPTTPNRAYEINLKTNLLDTSWQWIGAVVNIGNGADSFTTTNEYDHAFYAVEVSLPE